MGPRARRVVFERTFAHLGGDVRRVDTDAAASIMRRCRSAGRFDIGGDVPGGRHRDPHQQAGAKLSASAIAHHRR